MINFNNHNITGMSFDNHTIKKAYGCDGRLVWSGATQEYMLTYNCRGNDVKIPYNSSYTIYQGYPKCKDDSGNNITITNVVIGNKTKKIGGCAFCDGLLDGQSVMIPSSVEIIAIGAFTDNSGMTLTFSAPMPPSADTSAFTVGNGCKYIVPCRALERYKTLWSEIGNYITAATTSCTQLPLYDGVTYSYVTAGDSDSYVTINYNVGNVDRIDIEIGCNSGGSSGGKDNASIQTRNWFFNLYRIGSGNYARGHFGTNNGTINYDNVILTDYLDERRDTMIVRSSTLTNPDTGLNGSLTLYSPKYERISHHYSTSFSPSGSGYITLLKGIGSSTNKIYSVKMYYNDTLKANYLPATLAGVVGLYDTINNKFALPKGFLKLPS